MRRITLFFLLLTMALTLPGCSEGFLYADIPGMAPVSPSPSPATPTPILLPSVAPRASIFGLALTPVERLQPLADNYRYNDQVIRLCYESLFAPDERFAPQPLLCERAETQDNTVYTLTLREGVTFHDGTPLTAADAAYSFAQAKLPDSPYRERLACVASAAASGENTVTVTLTAPTFNATALFDFPIIRDGSARDDVAPGTGPYRAVLAEDPYLLAYGGWWQQKEPPVPRIELIKISSADELVYWFQTGYISLTAGDAFDTFSPGLHTGYETWAYPSGLMGYFGLNANRKPLDDPEMRRVLALALDRRALARAVYGDMARASALPVPPESELFSPREAARYAYDPGEAGRILRDMGYDDTDGDGVLELETARRVFENLSITMIVGAENRFRAQMAEQYAAALRKLGFEVILRPLTWDQFNKALAGGDFDIYYAEACPLPNFSPAPFVLPDGAFQKGGFVSETLPGLVTALDNAPLSERSAALDLVYEGIYNELPFLTVCFRSLSLYAHRGLVTDPTPVWGNPFNGWANWVIRK